MAVFNPRQPDLKDPSYIGVSKGITQPDADKSAGIAFQAFGNVLESGIKAADLMVKDNIEQKLYAAVDEKRDTLTDALERVGNNIQGGVQSLLGAAGISVPTPIERGLNRVQSIQGAADAEKIRDTQYKGDLTQIAKSLRAQFPGYRPFIDQKIGEITGMNPANAYYESMMAQINDSLRQQNSQANQFQTWIRSKSEVPGIDKKVQQLNAGLISQDDVFSHVANWEGEQSKLKADELKLRTKNLKDADAKSSAMTSFDNQASKELETSLKYEVFDGATETPERMEQLLLDAMNGTLTIPPDMHNRFLGRAGAAKHTFLTKLEKIGDKQVGPNGENYRTIVGHKEFNDRVTAMAVRYDRIINLINSKEYGLATHDARTIELMNNRNVLNLYNDPIAGPYNQAMGAAAKVGGNELVRMMYEHQLRTIGVVPDLSNFALNTKYAIIAQQRAAEGGPIFAMKDAIKNTNEFMRRMGITAPQGQADYLNTIDMMKRPDVPQRAKENLADSLFTDRNVGMLEMFKRDGFEPGPDGKMRAVTGKYRVWDHITDKKFAEETLKLGGGRARDYLSYVFNEFGTQLFQREIQDLNKIQKSENFKIIWDDKVKNWGVVPMARPGAVPATPLTTGIPRPGVSDVTHLGAEYVKTEETIRVINRGLDGLQRVAEAAGMKGREVDAFLVDTLVAYGFKLDVAKPGSIPEEMLHRLIPPGDKNAPVLDAEKYKNPDKSGGRVITPTVPGRTFQPTAPNLQPGYVPSPNFP